MNQLITTLFLRQPQLPQQRKLDVFLELKMMSNKNSLSPTVFEYECLKTNLGVYKITPN